MLESNLLLILFAIFMGCGGYLFFLWAVRDGQFDDCEQVKYQIMDDDD